MGRVEAEHGVWPAFVNYAEDIYAIVDSAFNPPYAGMQSAPTQTCDEIALLSAAFLSVTPLVVIEIGTQLGGSLFFWVKLSQLYRSQLRPNIRVQLISVDLPGGIHGSAPKDEKSAMELWHGWINPDIQDLHILRASSHAPATLTAIRNILSDRMVDFLFIDGDHTYAGVSKDYNQYSPLVRPGGIIAFHDTDPTVNRLYSLGVYRFVKKLKREISLYGEYYDHFGVGFFQKPASSDFKTQLRASRTLRVRLSEMKARLAKQLHLRLRSIPEKLKDSNDRQIRP